MTKRPHQRWIASVVSEAADGVPVLPWERAAKRARRLELPLDPMHAHFV
ncbi:MAG: hypothetical protein ACK4NW_10085 [Roseinatronobacter sp.]